MEIELQHGKKFTYVSEKNVEHIPVDENLDPLEQLAYMSLVALPHSFLPY